MRFREPLTDVGERTWKVPYTTETGAERFVGAVGDDHVCFHDVSGDLTIVYCTPFSNIISISYQG